MTTPQTPLDRRAIVLDLIEDAHALEEQVVILAARIAELTGHDPSDYAITDAIWNETDATCALEILMGAGE